MVFLSPLASGFVVRRFFSSLLLLLLLLFPFVSPSTFGIRKSFIFPSTSFRIISIAMTLNPLFRLNKSSCRRDICWAKKKQQQNPTTITDNFHSKIINCSDAPLSVSVRVLLLSIYRCLFISSLVCVRYTHSNELEDNWRDTHTHTKKKTFYFFFFYCNTQSHLHVLARK